MDLAETCVFSKQSQQPIPAAPRCLLRDFIQGAPLIPKLRGHFAEFLYHSSPERLRILTPPTCVSFSTVTHKSPNRGFSWETFKPLLLKKEFVAGARVICRGFPCGDPHSAIGHNQSPVGNPVSVTPSSTLYEWCRNINLLSIGYAFQPRLRGRLTLGGIAFPRKP